MKTFDFAFTRKAALAAATASFLAFAPHAGAASVEQRPDGGLTVSGTVRRTAPYHANPGAHFHVQLLDSKGRVVAEKEVRPAPVSPKRDSNRRVTPFAVKFAPAAGAVSARVLGHGEAHAS